MPGAGDLLHATAVAVQGAAALIVGPSGAGKSDLALRCLALPPMPALHLPGPARLLADDQVLLTRRDDTLYADCPATIRGRIEVRGLGILDLPEALPGPCRIALVVDVDPSAQIERLPAADDHLLLAGIAVPMIAVRAFEASAPIKVLIALHRAARIGGLG